MKFLVLKNEDIQKCTSSFEKEVLGGICTEIACTREVSGKSKNTYLVVNTDEPYAGQVADLIEAGEKRKGTWDHGDKTLREVMGIAECTATRF